MMSIEIFVVALALTGLMPTGRIVTEGEGFEPVVNERVGTQPTDQDAIARANAEEWQAREAAREVARRDREERMYEEGQAALEEGRWQRAIERFSDVVQEKAARADAAMYWRAYALDKIGQKAEALAAASELIKSYPLSKWI